MCSDNNENMHEDQNEESLNFNHIYKIQSESSKTWRAELDEYYKGPVATINTNILLWWKDHQHLYPNIAKMARDILCILGSSVPVERFFSSGPQVMKKTRTRWITKVLKF